MTRTFIEDGHLTKRANLSLAALRNRVKKYRPECARYQRVEGGFMVFDTEEDYRIWRRQK